MDGSDTATIVKDTTSPRQTKQKRQSRMDNPETLETLGTQDTGRR